MISLQQILVLMAEQEKKQADADIKNAEPFYQYLKNNIKKKAVQIK